MSLESEQATLGSAIQSAESFEALSRIVTSTDFFDDHVRCAWDALVAMREEGRGVDALTLGTLLDGTRRWQSIARDSGFNYLTVLMSRMPSFTMAVEYANAVKSASFTRRMVAYAEDVREMAYDGDIDVVTKLGNMNQLLAPFDDQSESGFVSTAEAAREATADIQKLMESGGGLSGLSTGWRDLDALTSGLQPADLVIWAGRPSQGKTTSAMNIANHVSRTHHVQIFSLEMPRKALARRTIAQLGTINFNDLKNGHIDDHHAGSLIHAGKQIAKLNQVIDDTGGLSVDQLRTRSRIEARKQKPDLIVVDYLQLLSGKGDNTNAQTTYIAQTLKELAKEMDCPVIAISQLNRSVEGRTDKRPVMSDLRDSGAIEQVADLIFFVYRDETYDDESPYKGIAELICRKQRDGEQGTVYLSTQLQYMRFVDMTGPIPDAPKKYSKGGGMSGFIKQNGTGRNSGVDF